MNTLNTLFNPRSNRNTNYIFSYPRMLDPKGNTAIYLLYAGARIASILRKAAVDVDALVASGAPLNLEHEMEIALGRHILRFQDAVEKTIAELLPSVLCEYVYNLCEHFTDFYGKCKVVGSAEQSSRLLLVRATLETLKKCTSLLGIGYLDRI